MEATNAHTAAPLDLFVDSAPITSTNQSITSKTEDYDINPAYLVIIIFSILVIFICIFNNCMFFLYKKVNQIE